MSVKDGRQARQYPTTSNFTEVTFGFERAGRGLAQNRGSALPAFDPPRDLPDPAEQVLDQVGGG